MTPEERELAEFERMRLAAQMERDWELIATYRENEQFYLSRLVSAARELGRYDERLG